MYWSVRQLPAQPGFKEKGLNSLKPQVGYFSVFTQEVLSQSNELKYPALSSIQKWHKNPDLLCNKLYWVLSWTQVSIIKTVHAAGPVWVIYNSFI